MGRGDITGESTLPSRIEGRVDFSMGSRTRVISNWWGRRRAHREVPEFGHIEQEAKPPVTDADPQEKRAHRYHEKHIDQASKQGVLLCSCWCERKFVTVTKQELREGVTHSCGHKSCKPPTKKPDRKRS
jgi:hypothetical protein